MQHNASSPSRSSSCVLAIGNFDGVHQGHVLLLAKAKAIAEAEHLPLHVLTFSPHPRLFFQPDAPAFLLTTPSTREKYLYAAGADHVITLPFSAAFASLSANAFIEEILLQQLNAKHIVVGNDFGFGYKRSGNITTLQQRPEFTTHPLPPFISREGHIYSSTAVRHALHRADFTTATKLLGRAFTLIAPVVHGDKRGRTLGYPTANQNIADYLHLPYGIYAVRCRIEGDTTWHHGVANFGIRPMFKVTIPIFETFIFDFSAEIYGKELEVEPVAFLRAEAKFNDLEALKSQMQEDCTNAKAVLKSASS